MIGLVNGESLLEVFAVHVGARSEDGGPDADVVAAHLDRGFEVTGHAHGKFHVLRLQSESGAHLVPARREGLEVLGPGRVVRLSDGHQPPKREVGALVVDVSRASGQAVLGLDPELGLLAGRVHLDHHSQLTRADPRAFLQKLAHRVVELVRKLHRVHGLYDRRDGTPVTRALTLLRWRCPMKCHTVSGICSAFSDLLHVVLAEASLARVVALPELLHGLGLGHRDEARRVGGSARGGTRRRRDDARAATSARFAPAVLMCRGVVLAEPTAPRATMGFLPQAVPGRPGLTCLAGRLTRCPRRRRVFDTRSDVPRPCRARATGARASRGGTARARALVRPERDPPGRAKDVHRRHRRDRALERFEQARYLRDLNRNDPEAVVRLYEQGKVVASEGNLAE